MLKFSERHLLPDRKYILYNMDIKKYLKNFTSYKSHNFKNYTYPFLPQYEMLLNSIKAAL